MIDTTTVASSRSARGNPRGTYITAWNSGDRCSSESTSCASVWKYGESRCGLAASAAACRGVAESALTTGIQAAHSTASSVNRLPVTGRCPRPVPAAPPPPAPDSSQTRQSASPPRYPAATARPPPAAPARPPSPNPGFRPPASRAPGPLPAEPAALLPAHPTAPGSALPTPHPVRSRPQAAPPPPAPPG